MLYKTQTHFLDFVSSSRTFHVFIYENLVYLGKNFNVEMSGDFPQNVHLGAITVMTETIKEVRWYLMVKYIILKSD